MRPWFLRAPAHSRFVVSLGDSPQRMGNFAHFGRRPPWAVSTQPIDARKAKGAGEDRPVGPKSLGCWAIRLVDGRGLGAVVHGEFGQDCFDMVGDGSGADAQFGGDVG